MPEHSFLWDIVTDLNAIWGEDSQRKTWAILGQNPSSGNVYESQRRAIVRARQEQYRARLDAATPAQLHLNAKIRAEELEQLYLQATAHLSGLNEDGLPLFRENMIRTLWDLTIGYCAASVITYYQQGIKLSLPASIRAEDNALAASAVSQGLTDVDTFLGILAASTDQQGGRNQGQPQPRPKDVILNNPTAVSLLKKMQNAGLLDANYQWRNTDNEGRPIRHTDYAKALFACYIDNKAGIPEWDKAFSNLWGLKHRTLTRRYSAFPTLTGRTQKKYMQMLLIFDTPNH